MNKQIRKLVDQAGFIRFSPEEDPHTPIDWSCDYTEELTRFAELIVRECARLAMTQHHSTSPTDYDEMEPYEQGCDDTASAISGLIRRTFGVE